MREYLIAYPFIDYYVSEDDLVDLFIKYANHIMLGVYERAIREDDLDAVDDILNLFIDKYNSIVKKEFEADALDQYDYNNNPDKFYGVSDRDFH